MRHPNTLPPALPAVHVIPYNALSNRARSCDDLGMCQHVALDCAHTCQREQPDITLHDDVALPATPAPLMDVNSPLTLNDKLWFWGWVAVTYLLVFAAAGYFWARWGESVVRAFWAAVARVS